jgi:hypothetical protein
MQCTMVHCLYRSFSLSSTFAENQISHHCKSVRAYRLLTRYLCYGGGLFLGMCNCIPARGDPIDGLKYPLQPANSLAK